MRHRQPTRTSLKVKHAIKVAFFVLAGEKETTTPLFPRSADPVDLRLRYSHSAVRLCNWGDIAAANAPNSRGNRAASSGKRTIWTIRAARGPEET